MTAIDEYLEDVPEPQKSTLQSLRRTIAAIVPQGEECISYGMPAFKLEGKAVAGFAAYKRHCSYFPHSGAVLEVLADDLLDYDWSKGTLRFPVDAPLPQELVVKLIDVRIADIAARGSGNR
ncbi:MAG: DUF1801 domain-containing protein [Actinomycetes bacterium]